MPPLDILGLCEFPLAIVMTGSLLLLSVRGDSNSWWYWPFPWMPLAFLAMVLLAIPPVLHEQPVLHELEIKNPFVSSRWYLLLAGFLALFPLVFFLFSPPPPTQPPAPLITPRT